MKIIILNQQKNKFWLKKLVNIIKKNDPKNKIIHLEKIREIDIIKNNCELLISFHNGQIIKPKIINLLKGYCINFHNSLIIFSISFIDDSETASNSLVNFIRFNIFDKVFPFPISKNKFVPFSIIYEILSYHLTVE